MNDQMTRLQPKGQEFSVEAESDQLPQRIAFIAAILLVLLFGYAAASKLTDYQRFVLQMQLAPLPVMKSAAPVLGWVVPLAEFTIVGMLLTEKWRKLGLFASFILLLVFEMYISIMLLSGMKLPCTCGGLISKLQWKEHLIFNAVFMAITISPSIYHYISKKSRAYSPQNI